MSDSRLIRLWDEKQLIVTLQQDAFFLIQNVRTIYPIKNLMQCHEILQITLDISERFPSKPPGPPECDDQALLHAKYLIQEINVCYPGDVPRPKFDVFQEKFRTLLHVFQVPRGGYV